MQQQMLIEIGKRIKEARTQKQMIIRELADRAQVSKGLISRIENGRTVPSLPVLLSIIQALEKNFSDFFENLDGKDDEKVLIIRKGQPGPSRREKALGFTYFQMLEKNVGGQVLQIVLLELEPDSNRKKVITNGFEFKYVLEGTVDYEIGDEHFQLQQGDAIWFDGRQPHVPVNRGSQKAKMLVFYFLNGE